MGTNKVTIAQERIEDLYYSSEGRGTKYDKV